MKKVLIFGSFDIIHPGHLFLIAEAKKYGEVHVGLALAATIRAVKGRDAFNSFERRKRNLEAYGVTVHAGHHIDRLLVVREVAPDVVVLGYDQVVFVDLLQEYAKNQAPETHIVRCTSFRPELFSSRKIRNVLEDQDAGFLLIDKPSGEPSLRTVMDLRRITGIRQIGFAGTLDPLASGLLVCGMSAATTLLDWFHYYPKTYEAAARLGEKSDTYDALGRVRKVSDRIPPRAELERVAQKFLGNIEQIAPMFSAKKVAGKKLYELARKGESVERKPQTITISALEIVSYEYPTVRFRVRCSSGTYVRSLIHDIGEALGAGALISALRRTAIGPYEVVRAIKLAGIKQNEWQQRRIGVDDIRQQLNLFFNHPLD